MGLRTVALRRPQNGLIALLATLLAAFLVLGIPAGAAQADTTDDGQEITQFYFAGNITFEGTPIDGVTVSVEGNGFDAKTETDAEGKWRLYVPEKEKYTLAVDEDSLPEGVIVDATKLPEGVESVDGTSGSFEAEFGLTGTKIINLFLGQGERITVSFT
ncbi:MAG TPA: branched-chain amino acid ABC transporter permease, partial [Microbacterium sp.]|nr:branched-chain amino acid ABC transporter permease [Microbacterium sp.]